MTLSKQAVFETGYESEPFNQKIVFSPNLMSTVMFIITTEIQIATFIINYRGKPFMESFIKNKLLLLSTIFSIFVLILCLEPPSEAIIDFFELVPMPSATLKNKIKLYCIIDFIGSFIIERICLFIFTLKNKYSSKYLVDEEHVDTEIKDYDGYTGFHLACDSGFLDIVEYLGHKPYTDIESHEINGKTPMFTACDRGQISVVKYLIETLHACKDVRNMYDNNALHVASINGNLPLVKYFIEDLHFDPHIRGNENKTLIHLACVDDRYDVIKYLVEEKHLDVDDADDLGKTGLHRAAFFGHYRLVEYFLKHNCNYMLKDKEGKTALHYACMYKRIPVINILLHQLKRFDDLPRDNDGKTPIHTAAQNGNLEGLKYLLETEHLDSEIKDFQGKTPLHVACQAGRSNIVNYLCSSKLSNINALDFLGNTPLILSCQSQNLEIVKILIQFKANTEIINADNNTALFYAKQGGNKELITILQENILA